MTHPTQHPQFKESTLIICVVYRIPDIVRLTLINILSIITNRPNTWLVIINNNAHPTITHYLHSIDHPQCMLFDLPFNFGKALAANFFCREHLSTQNYPRTIISLDPDTIFSKESFETLVEASEQLPQCGMLGMRYTQNECNPERNLFFKPKMCTGINHRSYSIKQPFMCTVAGPVLAIQGKKILHDCKNQLFPKKEIKVYGGDDSALYSALRWKYINGYLEGTEATHLFSSGKPVSNIDAIAHTIQQNNIL